MANKFVGIDWGGEEHAVCVLNARGAVKARFVVPHTADGIAELLRVLSKHRRRATVSIAIERPEGLLVDSLVDADYRVVPIHPNALKATRPRYSAAGAKDDRADAFVLADMLRLEGSRLRPLTGSSDAGRALKAVSRSRDDAVAAKTACGNQLRSILESFFPGALKLFADIDARISLDFLTAFPTPTSAKHLDEATLAAFLKAHKYPGRTKAPELLARLRAAPIGKCGPREEEFKGEAVLSLVRRLRSHVEECATLTALVERALAEHPDAEVIQSFPGIGTVNAAQVLAELGDERERYTSAEHLAAEAGVVPVTVASGKRSHRSQHRDGGRAPGVHYRRACKKPMRRAITCFADNSRRVSPWAKQIYDSARARGCNHNHAVRVLARAWLRVLWRCWRDRQPYDSELHGSARRAA